MIELMRTIVSPLLLILVTAVFLLAETHASSSSILDLLNEPRTMKRIFDPVEIEGRYLESFVGKEIARIKLFALHGTKLQMIRFQIDERTDKLEMMLTQGAKEKRVLGNGILDTQDILVFMISGVGERVHPDVLHTVAKSVLEIQITDPIDGERGYVYLACDPQNLLAEATMPPFGLEGGEGGGPYVVRSGSFMVQGRVNRVGKTVYQSPVYERWYPLEQAGGCGQNLFDSMKVRIKGSILFGALSMSVDETNIIGGVEATRVGTVRGYGRYWMQAVLPLRLKSPKGTMDVYAYDFGVLVPGQIRVPFNPGYVITDFQVMFGYDLSANALGMEFYNSNNLEGFLIDGRMSEQEKNMDTSMDEWRAVVGPQGAMITASVWDLRYSEQADISVHYVDDRQHMYPPENEPGSMGFHYNMSRIQSLRHGTYDMLLCWLYPPVTYDRERFLTEVVQGFLNIRKKPVQITIGDHVIDNAGGWPPLIKPSEK